MLPFSKIKGSSFVLDICVKCHLAMAFLFLAVMISNQPLHGQTNVTAVGDFQSELGCSGDWQPDCLITELSYSATNDIWKANFNLPTGTYQYKVAINKSWDENYGIHAQLYGPNIILPISSAGTVAFYYDHKTHWITDNINSRIVTMPGNYQSEIGCVSDWDPFCLKFWLKDPDGDGVYTSSFEGIPPGNYELKAAINENWNENYGLGGVEGGANIPFTVEYQGSTVFFAFTSSTNILSVHIFGKFDGPKVICPDLINLPYSVSAVPFADDYHWTFSNNSVLIQNDGSRQINLQSGSSFSQGTLKVTATKSGHVLMSQSQLIQAGTVETCNLTSCLSSNSDLHISSSIISQLGASDVYKAIHNLEIDASVTSLRSLIVKAGNQVQLNPFFTVDNGSTFTVQIEPCTTSSLFSN